MTEKILQYDIWLFRLINSGLYNKQAHFITGLFANDVFVAALVFGGLFFLFRKYDKKAGLNIAFGLWALIAADLINWKVLKPLFKRPRPFAALENVNLMVPLRKYGWAFPSTHSALTMAFAVVLWTDHKKARPYLAALVLGTGFFCVYTGGHYPLDVLAGWAVGYATGLIFNILKKKAEKKYI